MCIEITFGYIFETLGHSERILIEERAQKCRKREFWENQSQRYRFGAEICYSVPLFSNSLPERRDASRAACPNVACSFSCKIFRVLHRAGFCTPRTDMDM